MHNFKPVHVNEQSTACPVHIEVLHNGLLTVNNYSLQWIARDEWSSFCCA